MRVVSRIIGAVLVLCGLALLAIFGYVSATEGWPFDSAAWKAGAFFVMVGCGLILTGRHYLRLDPSALDQVQPPSSLHRFSMVHRRQLIALAQTGAVMSLIHFGATCVGTDWPGRWFLWPLGIGAVVLQSIARRIADPAASEHLGWSNVPKPIRVVLQPIGKAGDAAVLVMMVLICWNQWSGQSLTGSAIYSRGSRIVATGYVALLYVLEALFFRYGEIRQARG
jgi:hypothetical protein